MARIPGLYRRGSIFWVKYYVHGRPVREGAHARKETEAKRILDERRGRVATGQPIIPRADRVRYEELRGISAPTARPRAAAISGSTPTAWPT
jgi:hypothetical protein